jgi:hypothetical protein
MWAACNGHLDVCALLVASLADVLAQTRYLFALLFPVGIPFEDSSDFSDGSTALDYAVNRKYEHVAAFLRRVVCHESTRKEEPVCSDNDDV